MTMTMTFMTTWSSMLWIVVIGGQTLMYGTYSILVNLSKVDGEVPFHTSSLVLVTEVFKLMFCLIVLGASQCKNGMGCFPPISLPGVMLYAIPALCYTLNNNISIFMQTQMDPATYVVLGNMKVLTTGLLYQVIMKKNLGYVKWFSLTLLSFGGALTSVTALKSPIRSVSEIHCTWLGLVTMSVYCLISGFTGVYIEYQLKTSQGLSLLHQNVLLYSFGIVFNFGLWLWQQNTQPIKESKSWQLFHIFDGYSPVVWLIVFTQSLVGLTMSAIVKYKSNMTRVFVISSAPMVTTVLSCVFFHLNLQPMFILASLIVVGATVLYNSDNSQTNTKMKSAIKTNV